MKGKMMSEFKLVPVLPTAEMKEAVRANGGDQAVAFALAAWPDMVAAAPAALDRLSGRVTVSVKPLEWDEVTEQRIAEEPMHEHTGDYEAITPVGNYYIEMYFGSDSYLWEVRFGTVDKVADCDDPDTAKAAAQADFEARILAAIDTAPAPAPDQIRREALKIVKRKSAEARKYPGASVAVTYLDEIADAIEALITGGDDDHSNT